MEVLFRITLRRPDPSVAWGFKLRGGMDSKGTLTFQKIFPNSIADNCGLKEGDVLMAVAQRLTKNLSCSEVFQIIANSGITLEIIVERPEQSKTETQTDRFPLFNESHQPSIFNRERALSDDFARIWSTHRGKRLSSPPPFSWKDLNAQSSISLPKHSNISNYLDSLNSSSDVSMPFKHHDAFNRHSPITLTGGFKSSIYLEPSTLSNWIQPDDDFDKFRKVRFTEPPESNVIELDSVSSYVPSVDWNFKEKFGPFSTKFPTHNLRSANEIDNISNNLVDNLADEIGRIDLERYFPETPFRGFNLKDKPLLFSESQWQTSHCPTSSFSGFETFPRASKFGASNRISIPMQCSPREDGWVSGNPVLEASGFDTNISELSALNSQANLSNASDKGNFSRTSQFSQFSAEEKLQSPTNIKNSKFMTTGQNPPNSESKFGNLDLKKAGLFAVLDRSITDKLMNWNRPPDPERSATYKLLKEMEKAKDDDEYYG